MFESPDNNVNQICNEFVERSIHGYKKYGVTTERSDLDLDQWLTHLKEELMDAVVYIHRIQRERGLDKMTDNAIQLGLYNDTNMNDMSSLTVGGDTVTLNVSQYGAAMPAVNYGSLTTGDTITISLESIKNESKSST